VTTRLLAWLYTGPLGHLAAGVADWAQLLGRHVVGQMTARLKRR
jgi:hypothetical protein